MAPQIDRLMKIGHEGFALIDEVYGGRSRWSTVNRHQNQNHGQQPFVYYGHQISTVRVPVAASVETTKLYGGSIATDPAITSDQAAEYYGGYVIMDYGRRMPSRRDY